MLEKEEKKRHQLETVRNSSLNLAVPQDQPRINPGSAQGQPRISPGSTQDQPRNNPSTQVHSCTTYPTTPLAGRVVRGRCLPRNSRAAAAAIHWLFPPQCPRVSGLAVLCPLCFWLFSFWPGMFFLFLWGNFLSIHFLPPRCWWWWLLPPR